MQELQQPTAQRPDLVCGLVLVSPALPLQAVPYPSLFALRNGPALMPWLGPALIAWYASSLSPAGVVDERMRIALAHPERLDPGIRQRLVELGRRRERHLHVSARTYAAAARSLFAYLGSPAGMGGDIVRVASPALVIHGARDRLIPVEQARRLALQRPDWALEVFDDCGHVAQLEEPARFVESVAAFMSMLSPPAVGPA